VFSEACCKTCTCVNPLVVLKNFCQDLLKTHSEKVVDRVIFAADLIAYAFLRVSLSNLWEESI